MKHVVLVLWVALIGADRIDLSGGALGIVLTPFLVLTPILLLAQAADRWRNGTRLVIPRSGVTYTTLLFALLLLVGISVFRSLDAESSAARAIQLILQAFGCLMVALHVARDADAGRSMQKGAVVGIVLFAVVYILALFHFVGMLPEELALGPMTMRLDSYPYAGFMPRLSGTVVDPNRAGLVLVFYMVIAKRLRGLGIAMLLLTLSRSGALAGIGVVLVHLWEQGAAGIRIHPRRIAAVLALITVGIVLVARSPERVEVAADVVDTLGERFNFERGGGSADDHQALLVRAVHEGSQSMDRAMLGFGYGASHVVLQDFFPGNRYGNFHSLYASAFAETGIFSLVLLVVLLGVPLVVPNPWRGLVLACALFNTFYQTGAEPAFWLILAMAWLTMQQRQRPMTAGEGAT